ncbi:ABC transporter ATP-binding protein [Paenibacillus sp. GSMTC-2017]|uniref:ABC transporter ATP-binding protein n=1 Tax=Paenibacillus sp. GSMTC-2017 TaxID=2794350 RepID=UPI0018D6665B|nr:ABC transporter ATP-binding protein [Paenibacillus sp. GSMTC-2017]MBH5317404.1 ABC transporter ATP-binding protein [Paenibacillus sp. GSMTC-2017]
MNERGYRGSGYSRGTGGRRFGTGEKVKPASILDMFRLVIQHARTEWRLIAVALSCIIFISLLEFVIPQLTKYTIDTVIENRLFNKLFLIGASVIGAAIALGILRYLSTSVMAGIGQKVLFKLRNDLYRHLQRLDVAYYDRTRTGDLMSRVTSDVSVLQQLISSSMIQLFTDFFTFTAIAIYMLWIDWKLTVLLLATFPFMIVTTRVFGKKIRTSFRKVQESLADVSDHLQNSLTGIRLIKSFTAEEYEAERFSKKTERNMEANVQVVKLRAAYEPIIDFINFVGLAIVLVFGAWLAMKDLMTVGTIVAFIAYLRLLQNPVRHFSRILNTIQQAAAAYERILEVMNTKATIVDHERAVSLPPTKGHIQFRDVTFSYPGTEDVDILRNFDLELKAGEITALVGSSGSGKTTIAHLITRFYDVQKGSITVDGFDVRDVMLDSLRSQVGIVSQDIVLFNGSIEENIRYGYQEATEAEIVSAAQAANALDFIEGFKDGFKTQIGERGIKLSGGQKQRISIARAILKNPSIIILDEATASLDTESEQLIQGALTKLLKGRTCLVIAHRLSTIQQADHIYVLENGQIVENGKHRSLLERKGRYFKLHERQFPVSTKT